MSSIDPDAVREELNQEKTRQDTAFSNLQAGVSAFSKILVSNVLSTQEALADLTGISSQSAGGALTLTFAEGSMSSFTAVGFFRINVTDNGGNITAGQYYIPFGTLA